MLVYTLWHENDEGMMPWLLDAVDEYTVEGADFPPEYLKKRARPQVRELLIEIPESAVTKLFRSPAVKGEIKETP